MLKQSRGAVFQDLWRHDAPILGVPALVMEQFSPGSLSNMAC